MNDGNGIQSMLIFNLIDVVLGAVTIETISPPELSGRRHPKRSLKRAIKDILSAVGRQRIAC